MLASSCRRLWPMTPRNGRSARLAHLATGKIEQAKREWESTVDSLPDLICLVDRSGSVLRANRTVESWGLARVTEVAGRKLHKLVHDGCAEPACELDAAFREALGPAAAGRELERELYDPLLERYLLVKVHPATSPEFPTNQSSVVVLQDITERKLAEQEQQRLIEELDAFAHTVAHDLKNPLALMMGIAEELQQAGPDLKVDERQWCLEAIGRSGQKMANIIDELLLLAGVRKMQVAIAPLDMGRIVAEARQRVANLLEESDAEVLAPGEWPQASGYAPWVEEVWVNYLTNACKYGGRPLRIELGGEQLADGSVRFWVRDNGNGIKPEEQAQLFTPFTRLGQVRATGYGLGLSIARRIVDKLGGQVGLESEGVAGKGSVFSFTLPSG